MPDTAVQSAATTAQQIGHFDVVIVGAGISGIGGAYHLTTQRPGTSFLVLEERVPGSYRDDASGNNFLFRLIGVEGVKVVPGGSNITSELEAAAEEEDLKQRA